MTYEEHRKTSCLHCYRGFAISYNRGLSARVVMSKSLHLKTSFFSMKKRTKEMVVTITANLLNKKGGRVEGDLFSELSQFSDDKLSFVSD